VIDTDGDGIPDKDDACPKIAGPASNKGCPVKKVVSQDAIKQLNSYAKTILFNSGKSSFQQQTYPILQNITSILKEYPDAQFSIEGHTDSDGNNDANQTLSENRASAVKNYLVKNGIASTRLTSVGYGETKPVSSNKTAAGKAKNRRTEVILVKVILMD
ncbi:MAG: OmpA family protein, partial [Flavobacterium sp.]|uniref:OmpA family protein n=1 Tax=Flavobacterium sp. TaxID=239 RepID=UPI002609F312